MESGRLSAARAPRLRIDRQRLWTVGGSIQDELVDGLIGRPRGKLDALGVYVDGAHNAVAFI